jgi:hypothetical protein
MAKVIKEDDENGNGEDETDGNEKEEDKEESTQMTLDTE